MRKIIVSMWVSLDGFFAGPNNELDWVMADEANDIYENELLSTADTLLLGRVTYNDFAGSWPHVPDNPDVSENDRAIARHLNAMRKIVFSKTLPRVEWNNSTLMKEVRPDDIRELKNEPGRDMLIYGSGSIVQALTNLGLIDEYHLIFAQKEGISIQ